MNETNTNLSLYGITEEFKALTEMLESDGGEVTESSEALELYVANLLNTKTAGCVGFVSKQEDLIELAKNKINDLKKFIEVKENSIERFKKYVLSCMDRIGTKEIGSGINTIKERKPSKVLAIEKDDKIPAEFIEVEVVTKIKKNDLKKAIQDGLVVEGCSIIDGKRSLIFK